MILTHRQFWGSILHVDSVSSFIYNHLIEGAISAENLVAKHAYEKVVKSYGVKVKIYNAENLRLNDANYK